jgi:hypothetical protein
MVNENEYMNISFSISNDICMYKQTVIWQYVPFSDTTKFMAIWCILDLFTTGAIFWMIFPIYICIVALKVYYVDKRDMFLATVCVERTFIGNNRLIYLSIPQYIYISRVFVLVCLVFVGHMIDG